MIRNDPSFPTLPQTHLSTLAGVFGERPRNEGWLREAGLP